MAASLIESMTEDFDPDAHHDGYREALAEVVAAKAEGRDVLAPAGPAASATEAVSLVDALQASIAAAVDEQRQSGPRRARGAAAGKAAAPGTGGAEAAPPGRRARRASA